MLLLLGSAGIAQQPDCNGCTCFSNHSPLWRVEIDKQGTEYLVPGDSIRYYSDDIKLLIAQLNKRKKVRVKLLRLTKEVIYVKVLNSAVLTQTMGTDGANSYLAILVFTLTEYAGHKKVYIDFQQGDHGGEPGIRDRNYFRDLFVICPRHSS